MVRFLALPATLLSLYFVTALTSLPSGPLLSEAPPINALEPRQAPAVIATSDFLRRGYQASVVAGGWVYIDGGEFSFMNNGTPQFQYASTLLSIDLTQNWTNATVAIQSTTKPEGAPNLSGPSLWYHESENLIYSGFTGWNSSFGNDPNLPRLSLWAFQPDGTGSGAWSETITAESSIWSQLTRPVEPLMAFGSNSAWALGGIISGWIPIQYVTPMTLIPGMVQFDMKSRSFSNSSFQCCNATGSIYRGALQYVPSFGPEGIFIAMGGFNGYSLIDFGTISVFDPEKQEWWNQTTTGSEPSPRQEFCTAGINSTNGTYEIFVYAGWGGALGPQAVQYDTINILTLPAFHWISVPYNPEYPRHGHSCNAVGGSQILTIGGVDSNSHIEYEGMQDNIKSTFDTSPDPFAQGLAIFDMTTMAFSDQYTAGTSSYEQSDVVKQYYSQSAGAYMDNLTPQVSALLKSTNFVNISSRPASRPASSNISSTSSGSSGTPVASANPRLPDSNSLKAGAIAGIAVGAAVALCVSAAAIAYLFRRRATSQKPEISKGWAEMDEAAQRIELQGHWIHELEQPASSVEVHGHNIQELEHKISSVEVHGQSVQELEHPGFPAEMEGRQRGRWDGIWS